MNHHPSNAAERTSGDGLTEESFSWEVSIALLSSPFSCDKQSCPPDDPACSWLCCSPSCSQHRQALRRFPLRDSFGAGQSWGKRLLGLSVIEVDSGAPFGRRASALRNLPGLVSGLLGGAATGLLAFCGLVLGLIVLDEPLAVMISEDRLRIGDRWAGTQVVAD